MDDDVSEEELAALRKKVELMRMENEEKARSESERAKAPSSVSSSSTSKKSSSKPEGLSSSEYELEKKKIEAEMIRINEKKEDHKITMDEADSAVRALRNRIREFHSSVIASDSMTSEKDTEIRALEAKLKETLTSMRETELAEKKKRSLAIGSGPSSSDWSALRVQYGEVMERLKGVDLVFLVDGTGSMSDFIGEVKSKIDDVARELHARFGGKFCLRIAYVVYRDYGDEPNNLQVQPFTENIDEFRAFCGSLTAFGGNDFPEDVVGGMEAAYRNVEWKLGTRLIIHFGDAPPHGKRYQAAGSNGDRWPEGHPGDRTIEEVAADLCNRRVDYYFVGKNSCTSVFEDTMRKAYGQKNGNFVGLTINSETMNFLPTVIKSVTTSMKNSHMRSISALPRGAAEMLGVSDFKKATVMASKGVPFEAMAESSWSTW